MQKRERLIQVAGWYGVLAILCAYILLSLGILAPTALPYQLLNLTGALGIIIETRYRRDLQPLVLNIVWLCAAAVALFRSVLF